MLEQLLIKLQENHPAVLLKNTEQSGPEDVRRFLRMVRTIKSGNKYESLGFALLPFGPTILEDFFNCP